MAQPDNRIFSYPLPILTRVLHNSLIITNSISNFIKYSKKEGPIQHKRQGPLILMYIFYKTPYYNILKLNVAPMRQGFP